MSSGTDSKHYLFQLENEYKELAERTVKAALEKGADQAEAYIEWGQSSDVQVRMNEPESISQSSSKGLGLRVFKNGRLGFVSTTDFSSDGMVSAVELALGHADVSAEDEFSGLPELTEKAAPVDDILDTSCLEISTDERIKAAKEMETSAFDVDNRITNSEGSSFRDGCKGVVIANSNGLLDSYFKSAYSLICTPVVQDGDERRYGYWYSTGTRLSELENAADIGKKAGERAISLLGAKKSKTQKVPVIFDQVEASAFLGIVMSCFNGEQRYKNQTCLWDKLGKDIASPIISVFDDGRMTGGSGSQPFDGEGVATGRKEIITNGRLERFLYNSYAGRKDKTGSTGNGSRSYKTVPSINGSNFYMLNGKKSKQELIKSVPNGLFITGQMGFGINIVNGNYSRGAEGIWIENGELTYPVHEMTVSGNILEMLLAIEDIADDLRFAGTASSPSILIGEMVVAGE